MRNVTVIPANQIKSKETKSTKKKRVAAYCRVSTAMEEQAQSFDSQVSYYTDYIKKRPDYEFAGIYGDEGISGTSLKNREQFKRLIEDCEAGKIDLVITKSISRFARNTQDCLHYSRLLKNLGIGVFFEKEGISTTDAGGELLFTILSSLAQEESRNISENTTWGIRTKFKNGESHLNGTIIMGYEQGPNGTMIINEEQAKVVRRIYALFLEGQTPNKISRMLKTEGVVGTRGKVGWSPGTIRGMLRNEKYKGDSLLQKTYTTSYLSHKNQPNTGQVDQYYVKGSHPAIIDEETWEAVQLELARRDQFMKDHNLKYCGYASCPSPYIGKVFCGECGEPFNRHVWSGRDICMWQCKESVHTKGGICGCRQVEERVFDRATVIAWNSIVQDREKHIYKWKEMLSKESDPLSRLRAKQMIDLTKEGKIVKAVPEMTTMVLESMVVNEKTIKVSFLDGSVKEVAI